MKKAELLNALKTSAHPIAIVEYRGCSATYSAAAVRRRQGEEYTSKEKVVIHHRVELGPRKEQVEVLETLSGEKLPQNPQSYVAKFNAALPAIEPGKQALWHVDQWFLRDFNRQATGTLEPLDD